MGNCCEYKPNYVDRKEVYQPTPVVGDQVTVQNPTVLCFKQELSITNSSNVQHISDREVPEGIMRRNSAYNCY